MKTIIERVTTYTDLGADADKHYSQGADIEIGLTDRVEGGNCISEGAICCDFRSISSEASFSLELTKSQAIFIADTLKTFSKIVK